MFDNEWDGRGPKQGWHTTRTRGWLRPAVLLASVLGACAVQAGEGPLKDVAQRLDGAGIKLHAFNWNILTNNVSVGPRQGETGRSTNLAIGTDIDLQKMAGIPGATFHFEYIFFPANKNTNAISPSGDYFGAAGGFFAGENQSDISTGYLSQFTYEQHLFDGAVELTVGRFSAGGPFYHKGSPDCFLTVDCNDAVWTKSSGSLPPPYGSWAGMVKLNFSDRIYAKAGIFQLDLNQWLNKGHGFDWSTNSHLSNNVDLEIGYQTTPRTAKYPEHYWLTLVRNTFNLVSDDGSGDHDGGTTSVMLNGRKTVWRADGGLTDNPFPGAVMAYGGYSMVVDPDTVLSYQQRPYKRYGELGLSYLSPFGRPFDVASVSLGATQLSDRYLAAVRSRVPDAKGTSYALRAKYSVSLPHGFFIEPGFAYIVNPDDTANGYNLFRPSSSRQLDNGYTVRLMFGWNIGGALGL